MDAEDALSQAMVKAWEKVQKFGDKITDFKAWLIQLTRNLCIDICRKHSQGATGVENIEWVGDTEEMGMASSVESPDSCLEREERYIQIRRAIADLSERLRETFILHFYEELTHKEIAERQGISYHNVCRRISLARKELKKKLSSYFQGTEEKVSVTAGRGRKLSTPKKNQEKQQSIESEEKNGLEIGTKQLPGDGYSISSLPHPPIIPLQKEVVEVEKSEFVDGCVESGDNLGETIQEREIVSVEVESDRLVEPEKQEYVESAVESREQVDRKIQDTATELTEVEFVEVVEVEKDGCVESSVELNEVRSQKSEVRSECVILRSPFPAERLRQQNVRHTQDSRFCNGDLSLLPKTCSRSRRGFRSNYFDKFKKYGDVHKSLWMGECRLPKVGTLHATSVQIRLSRYVKLCISFIEQQSKDNKHIQKINNFMRLFLGATSIGSQKNLFLYYPLSKKVSSLSPFASCLSTARKSYQKKSLVCCLLRERSPCLRPYIISSPVEYLHFGVRKAEGIPPNPTSERGGGRREEKA